MMNYFILIMRFSSYAFYATIFRSDFSSFDAEWLRRTETKYQVIALQIS